MFILAAAVSILAVHSVTSQEIPSDVQWNKGQTHACPKWPLLMTDCSAENELCYANAGLHQPCHRICPPQDDDPVGQKCFAECQGYFDKHCVLLKDLPTTTVPTTEPEVVAESGGTSKLQLSFGVQIIIGIIGAGFVVGLIFFVCSKAGCCSQDGSKKSRLRRGISYDLDSESGERLVASTSGNPVQLHQIIVNGDNQSVNISGGNTYYGSPPPAAPEAATSSGSGQDGPSAASTSNVTDPPASGADAALPPPPPQDEHRMDPDSTAPTMLIREIEAQPPCSFPLQVSDSPPQPPTSPEPDGDCNP